MTATEAAARLEPEQCRVAVVVSTGQRSNKQIDLVLPVATPIEILVDSVVDIVTDMLSRQGIEIAAPKANEMWTLARLGGPPIPPNSSLVDERVSDGDLLVLRSVSSTEIFEPLMEDVIDGIADINRRLFRDWDRSTTRRVGLTLLPLGTAATAVTLWRAWILSPSVAFGLIGLIAGLLLWFSGIVARFRWDAPDVAYSLFLASLPLGFAAGALLIPYSDQPDALVPATVLFGTVIVATAASLALRITGVGIATLTYVTATACSLLAVAGVKSFFDVSVEALAACSAIVGIILLAIAPKLTVILARITFPVPAPSDSLEDFETVEAFNVDSVVERRLVPASAVGLDRRAQSANMFLTGLIASSSTVVAVSGYFVIRPDTYHYPHELALAIVLALALAFRSRSYADRVQAISMISASAALAAAIVLKVISTSEGIALIVIPIVGLVLTVGATTIMVVVPNKQLSPVTRRMLELTEYTLIASVVPLALWIMDLYSLMRNR